MKLTAVTDVIQYFRVHREHCVSKAARLNFFRMTPGSRYLAVFLGRQAGRRDGLWQVHGFGLGHRSDGAELLLMREMCTMTGVRAAMAGLTACSEATFCY